MITREDILVTEEIDKTMNRRIRTGRNFVAKHGPQSLVRLAELIEANATLTAMGTEFSMAPQHVGYLIKALTNKSYADHLRDQGLPTTGRR